MIGGRGSPKFRYDMISVCDVKIEGVVLSLLT